MFLNDNILFPTYILDNNMFSRVDLFKNDKKVELLGEGSYGCVYSPAIRCSKVLDYLNRKNTNSKNLISKVFISSNDFDTELDFLKSIEDIDKTGKYFVIPNKTCLTSVNAILKNTNKKCNLLENIETENKLYQIVMPKAGLSLLSYLQEYYIKNKKKYSLRDWIKNIKNVLLGIELLNKHSLVHRDIKSENILFNGNKMKIIDLGLMCPSEEIYKENNKHVLEYNYLSYPFEFLLVYFSKYASNFQKKTVDIFINFKQSIQSFGKTAEETFYILHSLTNIKKSIESLLRWKNTNKNWLSIIKQKTDKIDIYSFGTVCIELDNYLDKSTLSTDELTRYYDFLYKITMVDFRERYNINDAIKLYNKIL